MQGVGAPFLRHFSIFLRQPKDIPEFNLISCIGHALAMRWPFTFHALAIRYAGPMVAEQMPQRASSRASVSPVYIMGLVRYSVCIPIWPALELGTHWPGTGVKGLARY